MLFFRFFVSVLLFYSELDLREALLGGFSERKTSELKQDTTL